MNKISLLILFLIMGVAVKAQQSLLNKKAITDSLVKFQIELEKQADLGPNFHSEDGAVVYQKIRNYNQYPTITARELSLQFKFNDTLHTAFSVILPENYVSSKKYTVLIFLHGAVRVNIGYLDYVEPTWETGGWNRFYTKYAAKNNVIMIYPRGNRDYNWMYPDKGFYMVPAILAQVKKVINIDDDMVFISGHSNGATGSFSYAMKQPSAFAGFYGFNTRPKVATGGTYLRNMLNRSFFNVSTDSDYYYPPAAHDSLTKVMKNLNVDYQDHRYNGFPHAFPKFNESEPAHQLLFDDLMMRKRDPFRETIQWECDDVKYGRCDWIAITQLDTLNKVEDWQSQINFKITKWIVFDKNMKPIVRDTLTNAFEYLKQSGAVKASYSKNTFTINTSRVKQFGLFISPEMVDIQKPIDVIVNGKSLHTVKLTYNKEFIVGEYAKSMDRKAVWINYIDIVL